MATVNNEARINPSVGSIEDARDALAKIGAQGIPIGLGLYFDTTYKVTAVDFGTVSGTVADGGALTSLQGDITKYNQILWSLVGAPQQAMQIIDAATNGGVLYHLVGPAGTFSAPQAGSVIALRNNVAAVSNQQGQTYVDNYASLWATHTQVEKVSGTFYAVTPDRQLAFQHVVGSLSTKKWEQAPSSYDQEWATNLVAQLLDVCQTLAVLIRDAKAKTLIQ